MREPTVAASFPRALLDFAVGLGAGRDALLDRAAIEERELADPTARVSVERYVGLIEAAIDLCAEPALALRFGEHVPMEQLSMVALIATNASSPDDVRAKMNRYLPLMVDDGEDGTAERVDFVQREGKTWIRFAGSLYSRYPLVTEAAVARAVCGARKMLQAAGVEDAVRRFPEGIHFTFPEPGHRADYDQLFGVPLVFSSDMNAIAVDPLLLSLAMPRPYPAAVASVTDQAEQLLARLRNAGSTRKAVEAVLLENLESGSVHMESVARQLGLSRATLFRRLEGERTSFEEVLRALREKRAFQLLNEENRSVRQTAHLLGFSDAAAFSRAFKRWTGISPKQAASRIS